MRHGTPIDEGLRMAVYPIRPKEQAQLGERCPRCERNYTKKRKPVPTIVGYGTSEPIFDWECDDCTKASAEHAIKYPLAIVLEDTVNWRGDYWERPLHSSEARYRRALGQWVPEGYETVNEELHRIVATKALDAKFDAS
jgi:hypothetical protein